MSPISVEWSNNPLDLLKGDSNEALMKITVFNNTKEMTDITLDIDTNSEEILLYPTHQVFPKVAPGNNRKTSCVVMPNPGTKVFSGSYTINIRTNLGEKTAVIEIINSE
jgi:hypothetical protein